MTVRGKWLQVDDKAESDLFSVFVIDFEAWLGPPVNGGLSRVEGHPDGEASEKVNRGRKREVMSRYFGQSSNRRAYSSIGRAPDCHHCPIPI